MRVSLERHPRRRVADGRRDTAWRCRPVHHRTDNARCCPPAPDRRPSEWRPAPRGSPPVRLPSPDRVAGRPLPAPGRQRAKAMDQRRMGVFGPMARPVRLPTCGTPPPRRRAVARDGADSCPRGGRHRGEGAGNENPTRHHWFDRRSRERLGMPEGEGVQGMALDRHERVMPATVQAQRSRPRGSRSSPPPSWRGTTAGLRTRGPGRDADAPCRSYWSSLPSRGGQCL